MHFLLENVSSQGNYLVFGFYLLLELFACLFFQACFMRYGSGLVEHCLTVQMTVLYFPPLFHSVHFILFYFFHSVHFKEQAPCLTCWNLVTANYYACSFQLHKWKSNHGPLHARSCAILGKSLKEHSIACKLKSSQHWHWAVLEMGISSQQSKLQLALLCKLFAFSLGQGNSPSNKLFPFAYVFFFLAQSMCFFLLKKM